MPYNLLACERQTGKLKQHTRASAAPPLRSKLDKLKTTNTRADSRAHLGGTSKKPRAFDEERRTTGGSPAPMLEEWEEGR